MELKGSTHKYELKETQELYHSKQKANGRDKTSKDSHVQTVL